MPAKDRIYPNACEADPSIARQQVGDFTFPLGVYPIEPMTPVPGYSEDFEPADGADSEGEWEEWPDRYVYDIVVSADRLPALCRALFMMLPSRVYPILDVLGHDAYREIDPYISYELVGLDRVLDGLRRFGAFLLEDGMCGFGAMCDDPFFYVFIDEHKIVTVRCEPLAKERLEQVFAAFDLVPTPEPAGADAAAHEHRSVLLVSDDRPDLLDPEEVVERLSDEWRLTLNIDTESNQDDEGQDLGITCWRCIVRRGEPEDPLYAEVLLAAASYADAEEMCLESLESDVEDDDEDLAMIRADRMTPAAMAKVLGIGEAEIPPEAGIMRSRWVE